jgi:hypothetical protein
MNIKELNKYLIHELRNTDYRISRPWELLRLKYLKRLEVSNFEMIYLIMEQGGEWKIQIEERGIVNRTELFHTEKEACIFFKGLFMQKQQQNGLPSGWTETKISDNVYITEIPQEQKDKWIKERREKDKVEQLSKTSGFHDKPNGRHGTIYFVDNGKICELYYEISGVKEYDILIWFDQMNDWVLPNMEPITPIDKQKIKKELQSWLDSKNIRAEF